MIFLHVTFFISSCECAFINYQSALWHVFIIVPLPNTNCARVCCIVVYNVTLRANIMVASMPSHGLLSPRTIPCILKVHIILPMLCCLRSSRVTLACRLHVVIYLFLVFTHHCFEFLEGFSTSIYITLLDTGYLVNWPNSTWSATRYACAGGTVRISTQPVAIVTACKWTFLDSSLYSLPPPFCLHWTKDCVIFQQV